MAIKINSDAVIDDNKRAKLGMVNFGAYTLQQLRDKDVTGTEVGDFVYNIGNQDLSFWTGSEWTNIDITVSGGDATWQDSGFTYRQFTNPGSIITNVPLSVEVLLIAGGGGGGAGRNGGGGGAGGVLVDDITLNIGSTAVTVGSGGAGMAFYSSQNYGGPYPGGVGGAGTPSTLGSLTAFGGGSTYYAYSEGSPFGAHSGGSGSGATMWPPSTARGEGTSGQGNPGGIISGSYPGPERNFVGAGGGGAGGAAPDLTQPTVTPGQGGRGLLIPELGAPLYPGNTWFIEGSPTNPKWVGGFAGGGSGHGGTHPSNPGTRPANPVGGGGYGRYPTGGNATSYGAGGGGGGFRAASNSAGGSGFPGIVIVRYLTSSVQ